MSGGSSNASGGSSAKANPRNPAIPEQVPAMMNSVVLKHLFQYVDWDGLKACRQVCNLWYDHSFKQWLKKAPHFRLVLASAYDDEEQLLDFETEKIKLEQLLASNESAKAEPYQWTGITKYTNFAFDSFNFPECWENDKTFWRDYGSQMTNARLEMCRIDSIDSLRKILACIVTPKLEKLTFSKCDFEFSSSMSPPFKFPLAENSSLRSLFITLDPYDLMFPIAWIEIFQFIPNLQVLELWFGGQTINVLEDLLEGLQTVYKSSKKRFTKEAIPQLEELRIAVRNPNEAETLEKILVILEQKLCELTIVGFEKIAPVLIPKLDNLTHLSLKSYPMASMSFLTKCMRLKQLRIWEFNGHHHYDKKPLFLHAEDENGWENTDKSVLKLPHMEAFDCNYAVMYSRIDIMQLGSWFGKNLTCLKMHLSDPTFKQVCIEFRQLKTLYIYCNMVTMGGFFGYSLLPNQSGLYYHSEKTEKEPQNLLSLKELTHLRIQACVHGLQMYQLTGFVITEMSCCKGFLKLPKLKKLHVSSSLVSNEATTLLNECFPGWSY